MLLGTYIVPSLWLKPVRMGTLFHTPDCQASVGRDLIIEPSITGWKAQVGGMLYCEKTVFWALKMVDEGWVRRQFIIVWGFTSPHPAEVTNFWNCSSWMGASKGWMARAVGAPDSIMTRWKRGFSSEL